MAAFNVSGYTWAYECRQKVSGSLSICCRSPGLQPMASFMELKGIDAQQRSPASSYLAIAVRLQLANLNGGDHGLLALGSCVIQCKGVVVYLCKGVCCCSLLSGLWSGLIVILALSSVRQHSHSSMIRNFSPPPALATKESTRHLWPPVRVHAQLPLAYLPPRPVSSTGRALHVHSCSQLQ